MSAATNQKRGGKEGGGEKQEKNGQNGQNGQNGKKEKKAKAIITELSATQLQSIVTKLQEIEGGLIVKLTSDSCLPCIRVKDHVEGYFAASPDSIYCADLNIASCPANAQLYSMLLAKRMVRGVPTLLLFKKTDFPWWIPADSVSGDNLEEIRQFFIRCYSD